MSEQRLIELFDVCRSEGRAALLPYMTAGLPTPEASVELFVAMAEAGADGFEVGIPYADPLMDGPIIQTAGERALAAGSGVEVGLDILRQVVATTGKPAVVMTYVNPVLRMGIGTFADRVKAAGGSGVIIADLPVDEAVAFTSVFNQKGIGLVLFVAMIGASFANVGRLVRSTGRHSYLLAISWAMGVALFAQCVMFIGISVGHTRQNLMVWFLTLALVNSMAARRSAMPIARRVPRKATSLRVARA
mgnify:CR=1 FL=1